LGLGNFFAVGPGISLPLFNGGRIRSNIAVQTSRQRGAAISYQSVILRALEEVQNALVDYSQEQERRDRPNQAVAQNQVAVDLAIEQYRAGLLDFLVGAGGANSTRTNTNWYKAKLASLPM
jgi:outer membrane protein TolC